MSRRLRVNREACPTCPYLRSTPPGVWDASEYVKLAVFDKEPWVDEGSLATFHCHQENATGVPTACKGWIVVHRDSVSIRLAIAAGRLAPEDVPRDHDPRYYNTGAEAAEAGLAGVANPSPEAFRAMDKLIRRGAGRPKEDHVFKFSLPTFTIEDVRSWRPCWSRLRVQEFWESVGSPLRFDALDVFDWFRRDVPTDPDERVEHTYNNVLWTVFHMLPNDPELVRRLAAVNVLDGLFNMSDLRAEVLWQCCQDPVTDARRVEEVLASYPRSGHRSLA